MSETLQKQISERAAQMGGVLLQTVDGLIKDKRGAKTVGKERGKGWCQMWRRGELELVINGRWLCECVGKWEGERDREGR